MKDYYNSEKRKESYRTSAIALVYGLAIFILLLLGFGIIRIF
jgi:hypothetical protein